MKKGKRMAFFEMALLYGAPPILMAFFNPSRLVIFLFLWALSALVLVYLRRVRGFSWREIWFGHGWDPTGRKNAFWLFLCMIPVLAGLTFLYSPERFLTFPLERTRLWALVMLLYPVLSVIPQTLVFRCFFFARYGGLFSSPRAAIILNGLWFGLAHSMYGNLLSPVLSAIAGMVFARHYLAHRSLLWGMVEHAAYGCLIFTLGIGWFFFKH